MLQWFLLRFFFVLLQNLRCCHFIGLSLFWLCFVFWLPQTLYILCWITEFIWIVPVIKWHWFHERCGIICAEHFSLTLINKISCTTTVIFYLDEEWPISIVCHCNSLVDVVIWFFLKVLIWFGWREAIKNFNELKLFNIEFETR